MKEVNMSENWVQDINDMHRKFGVHEWVNERVQLGDKEKLEKKWGACLLLFWRKNSHRTER